MTGRERKWGRVGGCEGRKVGGREGRKVGERRNELTCFELH